MKKILWLCPILMIVLAVWVFLRLGFTIWAAVAISLLLVCPLIIIFGIITLTRHPRGFAAETLHTRGMPLDAVAPIYDRYCPKIGLGKAFRQETLKFAGLRPGEHVLDVGCGTGVLTRLAAGIAGPDGKAIGIDPAAKMISIAIRNAGLEKSTAEFRLAVIEDLPFEKDSFDCVLSSLMLHHLPPDLKIKGLSEVFRVLKPGGRLVLVDIDKPQPLWWIFFWPLLFWSFTRDQVIGKIGGFLNTAGFYKTDRVGGWLGCLGFWKAYK